MQMPNIPSTVENLWVVEVVLWLVCYTQQDRDLSYFVVWSCITVPHGSCILGCIFDIQEYKTGGEINIIVTVLA
jgi:hypothetical protein